MPPRFLFRFRWQMVLAVVGGLTVSTALSFLGEKYALSVEAWAQFCHLAGFIALAWTRALAVPLIFSSLVLGAIGLEPMRAVGKLAAKTAVWMVGSSVLAVLVALLVGGLLAPASIYPEQIDEWMDKLGFSKLPPVESAEWTWGWLGLVLISFGFAYYRNQLDENQGKLLRRFCFVLESILTPLLRGTRSLVAVTVFLHLASASPAHSVRPPYLNDAAFTEIGRWFLRFGLMIGSGGGVYLAAVTLTTWLYFKVDVRRIFASVLPAMWLAFAGHSVEAALPLTFQAVRQEIGVSNRVASVTLSLGAALHRDGLALGWMLTAIYLSRCLSPGLAWPAVIGCGLLAIVLGCGRGALNGQNGWLLALALGLNGHGTGTLFVLALLGGAATVFGAAISVYSQACAAAVIARSEGEYWVPGLPPSDDEVQRLKADLQAADE